MAYLRRSLTEDLEVLHPKNKLSEAARGLAVEYILYREGDGDSYSSTVKVGDKDIVTVLERLVTE